MSQKKGVEGKRRTRAKRLKKIEPFSGEADSCSLMKTFSSVLVFFAATLLTASCTQSIDVFQGRTRLKLHIDLPTMAEGTFEHEGAAIEPRFAMIVVGEDIRSVLHDPGPAWVENPRSYQFASSDGEFSIGLTDNEANQKELLLTAQSETDLERWVLVRLCRDHRDCSGAAPGGPVRDFMWHIQRAFYAGEETNTTLPITDSTDPLHPEPYGCIADEWAAGRTDDVRTELGKCFVFGCAQQSGDITWGCPGVSLDTSCEYDAAPIHSCEVPPSDEE